MIQKAIPHTPAFEMVVIGGAMLDQNAATLLVEKGFAELFYDPKWAIAFRAIKKIINRGGMIDLLVVASEIRAMGMIEQCAFHDLTEATDTINSTVNMEYYIAVLAEQYVRRDIIQQSMALSEMAYNPTKDIFDVVSELRGSLDRIEEKVTSGKVTSVSEKIKVISELADRMSGAKIMRPLELTLHPELNRVMGITDGGEGQLITVYGKPGHGKTVFQRTVHMALDKQGIPFWSNSAETSQVQMYAQMASALTGIPFKSIRDGNINGTPLLSQKDQDRVIAALEAFIDRYGELTSYSSMKVEEFCLHMKRLQKEIGLRVAIYDRVELMDLGKGAKVDAITHITEVLRQFVVQTGIHVILFAQTTKDVQGRPNQSNIKNSGSLIADSHVLMNVYYPYKDGAIEVTGSPYPMELLEYQVEKNSNGTGGIVPVDFNYENQLFMDKNKYPEHWFEGAIIGDIQKSGIQNILDPADVPF